MDYAWLLARMRLKLRGSWGLRAVACQDGTGVEGQFGITYGCLSGWDWSLGTVWDCVWLLARMELKLRDGLGLRMAACQDETEAEGQFGIAYGCLSGWHLS